MDKTNIKSGVYTRAIDAVGLLSIAAFSMCYLLFWSNFAELHIELPFLGAPVFVGEMLLFTCAVLLILKWTLSDFKFRRWHYLLLAYLLWVSIKSFQGYGEFGQLSFRNAALFYYPFFAVVCYHFYERKYFNQKMLLALVLVFIAAQAIIGFSMFSIFPLTILFLAAALKIKKKSSRYFAVILLLPLLPYKQVLQSGRSIFFTTAIICVFLTGAYFFIAVRIKLRHKLLFLVLVFFLYNTVEMNNRRIKSLVTPVFLFEQFKRQDAIIQKEKKYFQPQNIPVKLFNKNHPRDLNNNVYIRKLNLMIDERKKNRDVYSKYIFSTVKKELSDLNAAAAFQLARYKDMVDNLLAPAAAALKKRLSGIVDDLNNILRQQCDKMLLSMDALMRGEITAADFIDNVETITKAHAGHLDKYKTNIEGLNAGHGVISKEERIALNTYLQGIVLCAENSLDEQKKIVLDRLTDFQGRHMDLPRTLNTEYDNVLFRLFIWRDMFSELKGRDAWFGVSFGKPLRSISLEILNKGTGEWSKDGWIAPHNSFFHMIYRAGILGFLIVIAIFISIAYLTVRFIKLKSLTGILLIGVLSYWIIMANFGVVLELPYQAIPFWSLSGLTLAYLKRIELMPIGTDL